MNHISLFPHRLRSPRGTSPDAARAGFTLLEILLATLLASALLSLLWGTFNTYLRMFETGERVTREAQLLLGMSRQFTESIQGVPPLDPPPAAVEQLSFSALESPLDGDFVEFGEFSPLVERSPTIDEDLDDAFSSATGSLGAEALGMPSPGGFDRVSEDARELPKFGLLGSYDQLTLYGVQLVPDQRLFEDLNESTTSMTGLPGTVDDFPLGARELRTIHFRFLRPDSSANQTADDTYRGLLRVDTAWHEGDAAGWTAEQFEELLRQSRETLGAERDAVEQQIARLRQERDGATTIRPDQLTLFSEVAGIKFRYYDGSFWRDTWDSRLENRLPLAVEIFLQFREEKLRRQQLRRRNEQREASSLVDQDAVDGETQELDEDWNTLELYDPDGMGLSDFAAETDGVIHRLLIPCAGAASDARRTLGTESPADGIPGSPALTASPRGGGL